MKSFADWTSEIAAANNPAPECGACGQVPDGQGGEYPCNVCGLPTVHDVLPTALELGTAIHTEVARVGSVDITAWLEKEKAAGRDPFNDPYPITTTEWMRGTQWDPAELAVVEGSKPEVTTTYGEQSRGKLVVSGTVTGHIQGKAADIMLTDEICMPTRKISQEEFRREYLVDWNSGPVKMSNYPAGATASSHAHRVGTTVHTLMASINPDHGLLIEPVREFKHQCTRIRILDGYGTCIDEVIVE